MRYITIPLYTIDELSDPKARSHAIDQERVLQAQDDWWSSDMLLDLTASVIEPLGWRLKTDPDNKPPIYWSGFNSQRDGLNFRGTWTPDKLMPLAHFAAAWPREPRLHRILKSYHEFALTTLGHYYPVAVFCHPVGRYSTPASTEFEFPPQINSAQRKQFLDDTYTLMNWLYRQIETEYDYRTSDEVILESLRCNEVEFTVNGDRYEQ